MSNARYYLRRAAGLCPAPGCATPVAAGVYCDRHREAARRRVALDRATDREGYNQYMRVYKAAKCRTAA